MTTERIEFKAPRITDHGTIAEHTFTIAGGGTSDGSCQGRAMPSKDGRTCDLDCFGEYSCPS